MGARPTIREVKVRAVKVPMSHPHQTASGIIAESPLEINNGFTLLDDRAGSGIEWNEENVNQFLI